MEAALKILETPSGIRFGHLGEKPSAPAPTLIVVGSDLESGLTDPAINGIGLSLQKQGFHCVALDIPCHGGRSSQGRAVRAGRVEGPPGAQ